MDNRESDVVLIKDIKLTTRNRKIAVRAVSKSDIIQWNNTRGSGRLFSANLVDQSGEIRLMAFNDGVDRFYNKFEPNTAYLISGFIIQKSRKTFTPISHDFELVAGGADMTVDVLEYAPEVPLMYFKLTPLDQLVALSEGHIIDVIGMCVKFSNVYAVNGNVSGKDTKLMKRDVYLIDKTNTEISVTLWGENATKFAPETFPVVVCIKWAKVIDHKGGKYLSVTPSSMVLLDPKTNLNEEMYELRVWFATNGYSLVSNKLYLQRSSLSTNRSMILELEQSNKFGGNSHNFIASVTVLDTRAVDPFYVACKACLRKVSVSHDSPDSTDRYRCTNCKTVMDKSECTTRILIQMLCADASGSVWVKCFQEEIEELTGVSRAALLIAYNNDRSKFESYISSAHLKRFDVQLYVQVTSLTGVQTWRYYCHGLKKQDYLCNARHMLQDIQENHTPMQS